MKVRGTTTAAHGRGAGAAWARGHAGGPDGRGPALRAPGKAGGFPLALRQAARRAGVAARERHDRRGGGSGQMRNDTDTGNPVARRVRAQSERRSSRRAPADGEAPVLLTRVSRCKNQGKLILVNPRSDRANSAHWIAKSYRLARAGQATPAREASRTGAHGRQGRGGAARPRAARGPRDPAATNAPGLVPAFGIEPKTFRLQGGCSTN